MGGFLYVRKAQGESSRALRGRVQKSLDALSAKGMRLSNSLEYESFSVFVYNKARADTVNTVEFGDGGFIVSTGTLFYRGEFGEPALRSFHDAFLGSGDVFKDLVGQYSALVFKGGELYLLNDWEGTHHLFSNPDRSVISSSFLAVAKTLERRSIDRQGLFEFLSDGATYGETTILEQVHRLDSDVIHRLEPERGSTPKGTPYQPLDGSLSLDEQVEIVHEGLMSYIHTISSHFSNSMAIALSGGYDSRHLVGLLKAAGVQPYLYVYGPPASPDVLISQTIAAGEGWKVHHFDKALPGAVDLPEYSEIVQQQFHLYDAMGSVGAFGNGSDLISRRLRTETANLQINGSCGEAYRNIFSLPNRGMSVDAFVRARHDWTDWSLFCGGFDRDEYFSAIGRKTKEAIGVDSDDLTRQEIDRIYPRVRARYRVGPVISVNNTQTFAVGPFLEASMLVPTGGISWERKEMGRFHAALIRRADPRLAAYPSVYGHSFAGPIPWKVRFKNAAMVNSLYLPKPLVRALKTRGRIPGKMPWYLQKRYVGDIVDLKALEISRFIHVDQIKSPSMLSRALTVELLLADRF